MNRHEDASSEDLDDEIPLTPLIDAVFLLLIFFLVSTMIRKLDRDIDIALPDSANAERLTPTDDNRVIGIDADGSLYFEGEPTTLQALHHRLRAIAREQPGLPIRLDADRTTPTHRVVEVLDLCRFNQLDHVGIRTYDETYNRR